MTTNIPAISTLPQYSTFTEKSQHFNITKIKNIADFIDLRDSLSKERKHVFRGISNASYKIFTSLQRQIIMGEIKEDFSVENYIKAFRNENTIKTYFKAFNFYPTSLSILSFLQHHSAPTPLLDFTRNFDVATYFATSGLANAAYISNNNEIENYFSIFHISEDSLNLIDVKKVFEDIHRYKTEFLDSLGNQEINADLYLSNLDNTIQNNTMEVYLIDFQNQYPAFNVQNSIRILNQEGLFIHNSYGVKPLEIALKEFFNPATYFIGSEMDDADVDPRIALQNDEYRRNLEKNREKQQVLEKNIIASYEVHKALIPEIIKLSTIDDSLIYPNFDQLCKRAFEASK